MTIISPDEFIELKKLVSAECDKRNYKKSDGIASTYGTGKYDFTNAPSSKKAILQEHYEKIAIPLNAINKNAYPNYPNNKNNPSTIPTTEVEG